MKTMTILCGLLASAVLLGSCSKKDKADTTVAPVRVKAICVGSTDINTTPAFSGTIEESSGTALSFPVSGTVRTVNVSAGQRVAQGQLIATLDQSSLRNAYDIAKSTLDQAQDAYDRMKMLHDSNSLPDMQWVEVQNALKQAQSAEAIALKALKDANLYAPSSGYVAERLVEPGMTVAPIEPVVKIVNINPVKVNISVPENEISDITVGQTATISVDALADTFVGKITEKGVAANPISRAYDVKIRLDNPEGRLLPGMICNVSLESAAPVQAMVLPMSAVLLDSDNNNFVWTVTDGHAAKRTVKVNGMTDDGIVVTSGIAPGDSVIVDGQQKVSQNTPVSVIK